MADPICRWRNTTPETVRLLVELLPKTEMSEADYKKQLKENCRAKNFDYDKFLTTAYQLAAQIGLYYIDSNGIYHPRFNRVLTDAEANEYVSRVSSLYVSPNPYAKSMSTASSVACLYDLFVQCACKVDKGVRIDVKKVLEDYYKLPIGNTDMVVNLMVASGSFDKVDGQHIVYRGLDGLANDKERFFNHFGPVDSTVGFAEAMAAADNLREAFIAWMRYCERLSESTINNYIASLDRVSESVPASSVNRTSGWWAGIYSYLTEAPPPVKTFFEIQTIEELRRYYGAFDLLFADAVNYGGLNPEKYDECRKWAIGNDSKENRRSIKYGYIAYKKFLQWREAQKKPEDKKDELPPNVDRLSVALKMFAKKRVVEEWCSENTDGDANKPRAGYVVNKMRRGVPMAAPVVTQLQHGTAAQIRDWFKSANDPNSLKSVVDAVVDGDIVTFGSYLAHLIQPQVPAPARPSKFTRLLESVARNMIAPEKFGVYDENAHKALSFLGLISFGYNADFSDIDYEDALHAQRIILRRLREMKLPQVQEFGVTYNPPPDPNWKDADFLTVNEFLWFILQEDNLKDINKKVMEMSLETPDPNNKKPGNKDWKDVISDKPDDMMSRLVAALLTKPFAILAGASGTGKSRMVRKLAYMTCLNTQLQPNPATKKSIENFRMVQVKPNWHDSTDLLGYRSAVSGSDKYVSTDFVRFILKAHAFPTTPFFVCLDEMNLAPVEHYFAEFLSAMESGRVENGVYITDPVISPGEFGGDIANLDPQGYSIPNDRKALIETHGLYIPKNLFVVGTVNMDDSTRGFSRKVLDRAMTIVMDKVDFTDLQSPADLILVDEKDGAGNVIKKGLLLDEPQIKQFIERVPFEPAKFDDPFRDKLEAFRKSLANTALAFAFRFAIECTQYREAMRILYSGANPPITEYDLIALDHLTLMKLLPRLEGNKDERAKIIDALKAFFQTLGGHDLSAKELARMITAAETNGGYLSFWP